MLIARACREEMKELKGVHAGANSIYFKSLFEKDAFDTPWWFVHSAIIPPGGGIGHHRHDHCEEVFVTVDNASRFTHNGRTTEVIGGAAVPVRLGESHAIYNHTDRETRFFNFNVTEIGKPADSFDFGDDRSKAPVESTDRLPIGKLDRRLLEFGRMNSGKGVVGSRIIWDSCDFRTNFGYIMHCLLPPNSSIGYHKHEAMEEVFIVINGRGRIISNGSSIEVAPGDAILNKMGDAHGLHNDSSDFLEILAVSVTMEKGKLYCVDLDDCLS